jgi:cell division transport system permease protein
MKPRRSPRGAAGAPPRARPTIYFKRHAQALRAGIQRLAHQPAALLLTTLVIGIALALPALLLLGLSNLQQASTGWYAEATVSVFLKDSAAPAEAETLARQWRALDGVAELRVISRAAALAELERVAGLGDAVASLSENPLPIVIAVRPAQTADHSVMARLTATFAAHRLVDFVQNDAEWLSRLRAWLALARRVVLIFGALLLAGALLVVGNTLRLEIGARRDEIELIRLLGGSAGYVRRPFLYTGALQGLAGGIAALAIISICISMLGNSVGQLAGLYGSGYAMQGPGPAGALALLATSLLLGVAGAWLAVGRHLRTLDGQGTSAFN